MKIARFLGALLVLSFLVACNDSDLPPTAKYASVTGVVVDRGTNAPIANAVVTIDTVLTMTTTADGKFNFVNVPAGDVDYTVQAPGYAAFTSSIRVEPDKSATLNVVLNH
ncbi:MAG: carboxypeptidase-like regulatory domain-containing protein [Candidatus Eremiobacteraeota bacterium]|nr:carboxypeptidase-like regulatory domain-containing protein [Candidatus Eremiobacteraeota bacterium]